MMSFQEKTREGWCSALRDKDFIRQGIVTLLVGVSLLVFIIYYFDYIQARPGKYINDPLLERIPPRNLSLHIFLLLYGGLIFAFAQIIHRPWRLLIALQSYCLIIVLRIITLYLVPLEPPSTMIPLRDPLVDYFIYQKQMISKDLFFSGHVSTMFLGVLVVIKPWQKIIMAIITILVAVFILAQHVHYTIDVIAAPFFTLLSYYLVVKFHQHSPSFWFKYLLARLRSWEKEYIGSR